MRLALEGLQKRRKVEEEEEEDEKKLSLKFKDKQGRMFELSGLDSEVGLEVSGLDTDTVSFRFLRK